MFAKKMVKRRVIKGMNLGIFSPYDNNVFYQKIFFNLNSSFKKSRYPWQGTRGKTSLLIFSIKKESSFCHRLCILMIQVCFVFVVKFFAHIHTLF